MDSNVERRLTVVENAMNRTLNTPLDSLLMVCYMHCSYSRPTEAVIEAKSLTEIDEAELTK